MGEVLGVAASVVTLAALFSSCVESFSYFKAAQNCPAEADSLLVKLDCEKARLLVWGNTVGIVQTDPQRRYAQLANLEQNELIRRCIEQIIRLLNDARTLQAEYGGRATSDDEIQRYLAVLSVNSMNVFQAAKRTFFARAGTKHATPNLLSRVKWAIRDAAKFRVLLINLREFVDNLIQLVPLPANTVNNTIEEDIVSTVDIESLRLIEDACDDDSYPQWSARASEVIRESEAGSIDRRNFAEMLRDTYAAEGAKSTPNSQSTASVQYSYAILSKTSLVFTDKCLNVGTSNSVDCDESKIASLLTVSPHLQTSFAGPNSRSWNLGRRLLGNIGSLEGTVGQIRAYVHCGACVCAINTALDLNGSEGTPMYTDAAGVLKRIDFVIRIDDRIPTSCQETTSKTDILTAIREEIEVADASDSGPERSLAAIDCPALEKRIFALEQEGSETIEPANAIQRILTEEYQPKSMEDPAIVAIIFIIEADLCSESLERRPFRTLPRKPRASEIYALEGDWSGSEVVVERKFIGRFHRSKIGIERQKEREEAFKSI